MRPVSSSNDAAEWRSTTVVDGDTLYVVRVRAERRRYDVVGVNTPETGECFSDEATDSAGRASSRATDLVLVADRSDVDQFGRALRYVETGRRGRRRRRTRRGRLRDRAGGTRPTTPEPTRTRRSRTRGAGEQGRGLWASDACGARATSIDVDIAVEVNADAPGDDGENLNGEWVVFTNLGAAPVDLDGWEVADESASHRYEFADLRLAAGAEVTLFSGCGRDDDTTRHWCASGSAIWNNSGDTVFLRDANGNIVVAYSYGDSG